MDWKVNAERPFWKAAAASNLSLHLTPVSLWYHLLCFRSMSEHGLSTKIQTWELSKCKHMQKVFENLAVIREAAARCARYVTVISITFACWPFNPLPMCCLKRFVFHMSKFYFACSLCVFFWLIASLIIRWDIKILQSRTKWLYDTHMKKSEDWQCSRSYLKTPRKWSKGWFRCSLGCLYNFNDTIMDFLQQR